MKTIDVVRKDPETFEVTIRATTITTHTVTLGQHYHRRLTGGRVSPEVLIEKSFEFLLEKEPNTSILSRFDLPLIGRYFPEYEKVIGERV
jgi:predicted PolB exonuclease-like 3'-5' exonuclease